MNLLLKEFLVDEKKLYVHKFSSVVFDLRKKEIYFIR